MKVAWSGRGSGSSSPPRRHQLQGSALGASSTSRSPSCSEAVLPSPTLLTPFPLSPPSPRGPQGEEGGTGRVLPAALRRRPAAGSSYSGPGSMAAAALGGGEQGWGTPGKNPGAAAEPDALSPIYKQGPPAVRMSAWDFFRSFPRPFPFPKGLQCSHCIPISSKFPFLFPSHCHLLPIFFPISFQFPIPIPSPSPSLYPAPFSSHPHRHSHLPIHSHRPSGAAACLFHPLLPTPVPCGPIAAPLPAPRSPALCTLLSPNPRWLFSGPEGGFPPGGAASGYMPAAHPCPPRCHWGRWHPEGSPRNQHEYRVQHLPVYPFRRCVGPELS